MELKCNVLLIFPSFVFLVAPPVFIFTLFNYGVKALLQLGHRLWTVEQVFSVLAKFGRQAGKVYKEVVFIVNQEVLGVHLRFRHEDFFVKLHQHFDLFIL